MSDDAMAAQAEELDRQIEDSVQGTLLSIEPIAYKEDDFERLRSALGRALGLPMIMLIEPLAQATEAVGEWSRGVQRLQNTWARSAWGTKAPGRKRKRRVAKKLAARGGYMRYGSLGAKCAGWRLL